MEIETKQDLIKKLMSLFNELELRWDFKEIALKRKYTEIIEDNWAPFLKKKFKAAKKVYVKDFYSKLRRKKTIYIYSSVLVSNDINDQDYIWILEKEEGNPVKFFWFPIIRSENFIDTVLEAVKAIIEVTERSPFCSECNEELFLVHYTGVMHLMAYICGNSAYRHQKQNIVPYAVFDNPNLSDETSLYLFNRYKQFYEGEYRRQLADPDRKHYSARVLRAEKKAVAQEQRNTKRNHYGDIRDFPDDKYYDGAHIE
jgi:hypothetical protein